MWLIWGFSHPEGDVIRIGSNPRPDYVWPPREAQPATCRGGSAGCDRPPRWGCRCGYYGLRREVFVQEMMKWAAAPFAVLGKVYLWGRVTVCERGWKAQYAYPAELYLPSDAGWDEATLVERGKNLEDYGVPVDALPLVEILQIAGTRGGE